MRQFMHAIRRHRVASGPLSPRPRPCFGDAPGALQLRYMGYMWRMGRRGARLGADISACVISSTCGSPPGFVAGAHGLRETPARRTRKTCKTCKAWDVIGQRHANISACAEPTRRRPNASPAPMLGTKTRCVARAIYANHGRSTGGRRSPAGFRGSDRSGCRRRLGPRPARTRRRRPCGARNTGASFVRHMRHMRRMELWGRPRPTRAGPAGRRTEPAPTTDRTLAPRVHPVPTSGARAGRAGRVHP
jgi:hypothetical protein